MRAIRSMFGPLKYRLLARRGSPLISPVLTPFLVRRLRRVLQHSGVPALRSSFTRVTEIKPEDVELARRLLAFWAAMERAQTAQGSVRDRDVWTDITARQKDLVEVVNRRDPHALADYLRTAPRRPVLDGVLQGDIESAGLERSASYRDLKARLTVDRFLSLMEAIGALPVQSPEQGAWGVASTFDQLALIRELDATCGMEVNVPQVFDGLFVTFIGGRPFNQVDLMALHSALRLRRVLAPSALRSIVEIGAGSGRTAYWALRLGLGPIQIIDLPHVAMAQAWYLAKALPGVHLHLYGEPAVRSQAAVTIFPDSALDEVPPDDIGIVFNQDSFPEMSATAFARYVAWITRTDARLVFSVNHETRAEYGSGLRQLDSSRMLRDTSAFELLDRQRNWIRLGHVDELYAIRRGASGQRS